MKKRGKNQSKMKGGRCFWEFFNWLWGKGLGRIFEKKSIKSAGWGNSRGDKKRILTAKNGKRINGTFTTKRMKITKNGLLNINKTTKKMKNAKNKTN